MEELLKERWSKILDIDSADIKGNSDFFEEGGDSVKAIGLVAEAREQKIEIDTESIFTHPELSVMAGQSRFIGEGDKVPGEITTSIDKNLAKVCADACQIDEDTIEDIFPSPYIQAMMLEGHIKAGSWSTQLVFQLIGDCDKDTLRKAWKLIQETNPILRTRIVQHGGKQFQVVVKEAPPWFEGSNLQEYKSGALSKPFHWGSPLFHYALISEEYSTYFVWTAHHSGFDGWTRNLLISDLAHLLAKNGAHSYIPHRSPYKSYVDWQLSLDPSSALSAWRTHLKDFNPRHLENLYPISPRYLAVSTSQVTRSLPFSRPKSPFTLATMVNTAYALAIAHISRLDDILFWAVRSGRQVDLPGVESIMGPVLTGVPLRIKLDPDIRVEELMRELQRQTTCMMSYETYALQALAEHIGHRNVIQSVVNYRPPGSDSLAMDIKVGTEGAYLKPRKDLSTPRTTNLGLTTAVLDEGNRLDLITDWDENLIQEAKVVEMIEVFMPFLKEVIAGVDRIPLFR
ncbi:MAG: hypothetical protein Q9213_000208 [Squamulea squamosa]